MILKKANASKKYKIEIGLSIFAIVFTLVATLMVSIDGLKLLWGFIDTAQWGKLMSHGLFLIIMACLIYGGLVFLLTRAIYYFRRSKHEPVSLGQLNKIFKHKQAVPLLTILVPSYKEEDKTIYQTLMSAALQHFPKKRVVLLIDDPVNPSSQDDKDALNLARSIPAQIMTLFKSESVYIAEKKKQFITRITNKLNNVEDEIQHCLSVHSHIDAWFEQQALSYPVRDHADRAFISTVIDKQRQLLKESIDVFLENCQKQTADDVYQLIDLEFNRFVAIFDVEVTSFERKSYDNLSHEPNKAMNLNSYIGLIGNKYQIIESGNQRLLSITDNQHCDLNVPDSEFIITLDADSIVVPDYAIRLIDEMKKKKNDRMAVIQTPYSAFPGAKGSLERVAGATTDMQYIIHQGFTGLNGTYWVGANALLRKSALDDIATQSIERGHCITRYIQDRTVIEDTESSVDLTEKGWQLFNYPERMAYSATPPDFGALIIQRRRWANGGLIILPKLLRYFAKGPVSLSKVGEAFVRIHYLASIALVNLGLVIVLAVPLATDFNSPWLPLTALAYFILYARDLKLLGYQYFDIVRVYALNLLMIPVNLAGVFKSLQQAWTGEQIPFGRTPKVVGRTVTPAIFIFILGLFVINWLMASSFDIYKGFWFHATFALLNALMMIYAMVKFIGIKESWEDFSIGFQGFKAQHLTFTSSNVADITLTQEEKTPTEDLVKIKPIVYPVADSQSQAA